MFRCTKSVTWRQTLLARCRPFCPIVAIAVSVSVSVLGLSQPASGQGFFFGPSFGPSYGWGAGPWGGGPWRGGQWGGLGVAPSRIDITIGVPPSHPYPIGVHPSQIIPSPFPYNGHRAWGGVAIGGYRDYRSEYNLRVLQAHRDQLEFAEALGLIAPRGIDPLHQDEVYRRFGSGSVMNETHVLPQSPLDPMARDAFDSEAFDSPVQSAADDWPIVTPENLAAISDQLIQSARRLDESLSRRGEEGDVWRQYLSTEVIVASNEQPLTDSEWIKVLQNFDGVLANGDLRWVMRSDGFAETRQWASALVNAKRAIANQPSESDTEPADAKMESSGAPDVPPPPPSPSRSERPAFENLPTPTRARL